MHWFFNYFVFVVRNPTCRRYLAFRRAFFLREGSLAAGGMRILHRSVGSGFAAWTIDRYVGVEPFRRESAYPGISQ